ncbi:MAG TPA: hypothetical protein PK671_15825 [Candidatus Obscuribacter sp.]|nr:hypothetical protein [Candidatus Obscuribacter sp.]
MTIIPGKGKLVAFSQDKIPEEAVPMGEITELALGKTGDDGEVIDLIPAVTYTVSCSMTDENKRELRRLMKYFDETELRGHRLNLAVSIIQSDAFAELVKKRDLPQDLSVMAREAGDAVIAMVNAIMRAEQASRGQFLTRKRKSKMEAEK